MVCAYRAGSLSARVTPPEYGASGRDDAEARLAVAAERLHGRTGVRFVTRAARSAAAALHEVAEEADAELVVVGSSHRGALRRILPGTTAAQVLSAAPCAVAVAPIGFSENRPGRIQSVGAGFDGGPESAGALQRAARLAVEQRAVLRAFAVVEPVERTFGWAGDWIYPEYVADAVATMREELAAARGALHEAPRRVTEEVLEGDPATELVRVSEQVDVLVLGSRGYGPVGRLVVGSVAARVATAAACPLVLCPRAGE
ncbi:Universal stress protein [Capillimicrobium parvum]|uniref:Universal stress protein n=1 Tax=Capillimicrobium parvum TaxID=2884022 RepID=A0A9E7BYK8_9ACTN|nr:Universal stress protein [Capillimicrobium parvum]